jgi:hypothetical protein
MTKPTRGFVGRGGARRDPRLPPGHYGTGRQGVARAGGPSAARRSGRTLYLIVFDIETARTSSSLAVSSRWVGPMERSER